MSKILINKLPKYGPWGGGIKFVNKLIEKLRFEQHEVVHSLEDNIDLIFCFDPRENHAKETYLDYIKYTESNPGCKMIQRVGDIGTHGKPWLRDMIDDLKNKVDYLIFPSNWAYDEINSDENSSQVIFNAPDKIFYENRSTELACTTPLNIVTHYWLSNPKKGFELYKEFDNYCNKSGEFTFTFIGNLPEGMSIGNHIPPLNMEELSKQLPRYDVYITASEEEAGANHVLEAMACGLPIVYLDKGGSIPDYCNKYGTQYKNIKELILILKDIKKSFPDYKSKVLNYTESIEEVIESYYKIIQRCLSYED